MNSTLRLIFAVLAGIVLGGIVNMLLITVGSSLVPAPDGIDATDMESVRAGLHLFEPKHFLFPFVAHAGGTLIGALIAGLAVTQARMRAAMLVGGFYLIMGIFASTMIPAPVWFIVVDVVFGYLPMGWVAGLLALKLRPETT